MTRTVWRAGMLVAGVVAGAAGTMLTRRARARVRTWRAFEERLAQEGG